MAKTNKKMTDTLINKSFFFRKIIVYILAAVTLTATIVRYKAVEVVTDEKVLYSKPVFSDYFTYYKAMALLALASIILALGIAAIYTDKDRKMNFSKKNYFSPMLVMVYVFLFFTFLSTLFSKYIFLTLHGSTERCESVFMLFSYMLIFVAAMYAARNCEDIYIALYGLIAAVLYIGVVGAFQYFGKDLFATDTFAQMMMGENYVKDAISIRVQSVYSTMYNPNNMGQYAAMVFPATFVLGIFAKYKSKFQISALIASAVILISLIGTTSRGAYVALFVCILFAAVLLTLYGIKHGISRKVLVGASASFAGVVLVFSVFIFSGGLVDRFSSIFDVQKDNEAIHYIKKMEHGGNKATVETARGKAAVLINDGIVSLSVNDANAFELFDYREIKARTGPMVFNDETFGNIEVVAVPNSFTLSLQGPAPIPYTFLYKIKDGKPQHSNVLREDVDLSKEAPYIGFKGYEDFGSNRGYIWSRSLPLLLKNPLVGSGPDTFMVIFPRYDLRMHMNTFFTALVIPDKPHNMYLQTAITTGVVSALALIGIFLYLVCLSVKTLLKLDIKSNKMEFGFILAFLLGSVGYAVGGLTVDGTVAVSPTYWVIAGLGFASIRLASKKISMPSNN